ncbi:MAG: NAD(P)/FAD-dependent oxidoreductase [Candidatus Kerfeldbacteria bacterium]|nr:NAD(P)/FAD-dependent oxidoreductase [Candidatus Kerfeldbacteria bacterium]
MSKRVVILGAGFAGLSAALELGKLKRQHRQRQSERRTQEDIDIVLIDRNDFQLFTPDLYEIASAAKEIENEEQLKQTVTLNIRTVLGKQSVGFIQADIQSVDSKHKQVMTSKGEVDYDYLIFALGSEPFYFGIPGMQEHSIPFKWIDHAVNIRKTVYALMEAQPQVHVIICGAGAAGVELAAEMRQACIAQVKKNCFAITIVEGRDTVLPPFSKKTQTAAAQRLKKLGIRMKTNFLIAQAEKGKVISTTGEVLEGDMIIWTGGIGANSILRKTDFVLTKRGQLTVRSTLQLEQQDNVFAIGDSAECSVGEKQYAPQTAHEAVHQGPIAAANVMHLLRKEALENYTMKNEGIVITMGGKNGIVELPNGWVLTGMIGWFVRKFVDFRHFKSVLPFMQACSLWYRGLRMMIKNDSL